MMHLDINEFSSGAVSARACLEDLARVLGVELDDAPDAVLSIVVDEVLPVTVAHGNHGRVALACNIAQVDGLTQPAWIAALSTAAQWGLDGEALRFVVIGRFLMLLWTVRPGATVRALTEQAEGVIARAREVQRLLDTYRLDDEDEPEGGMSPSAVSNAQHRL
jgi:hypothetical protein